MYRRIDLSNFKPTKGRFGNLPFVTAFVYPKNGEPVMITGIGDEVWDYINSRFTKALIKTDYWKNGTHRGSWHLHGVTGYIFSRGFCGKGKYTIQVGQNKKTFKRMPHKWIPFFDSGE